MTDLYERPSTHNRSGILPFEIYMNDFEDEDLRGIDIVEASPETLTRLAKDFVHAAEIESPYLGDLPEDLLEDNIRNLLGLVQRYKKLAQTDPLTQLLNKATLYERIENKISALEYEGEEKRASNDNAGSALVIVDLDKFKPINDLFGHAVGDMALKAVSETLKKDRRAEDKVARVGGDEFAVLLGNVDEAGAQTSVERLQDEFNKLTIEVDADHDITLAAEACAVLGRSADRSTFKANELSVEEYKKLHLNVEFVGEKIKISVNASFGMAMLQSGMTAEDLDKRADHNMYQNKIAKGAARGLKCA